MNHEARKLRLGGVEVLDQPFGFGGIDRFDLAMTGQFLGYKGNVLPW